jgi:histone H2A
MPRSKTTERKESDPGTDSSNGKKKTKSKSRNEKAGLTIPISRVAGIMKREGGTKRVGGSAPVYMSAVAEYVAAELLAVAGNNTIKHKRKRITPEDIAVAIRSDRELNLVCGNVAFAVDGVVKGVVKTITPGAAKPSKPAAEEEAPPKTPPTKAPKTAKAPAKPAKPAKAQKAAKSAKAK